MKKLNPFITLADLKNIEGVSHTLKYPPNRFTRQSVQFVYTFIIIYIISTVGSMILIFIKFILIFVRYLFQ